MKNADKRPSFLVIDDDENFILLVEHYCAGRARITPSHKWIDAKQRLQEEKFDAICLDLVLPDGEDIFKHLEYIRNIDTDYPVIVVSGNPTRLEDDTDRLMRMGVNDILSKPFEEDGFKVVLERLLNRTT